MTVKLSQSTVFKHIGKSVSYVNWSSASFNPANGSYSNVESAVYVTAVKRGIKASEVQAGGGEYVLTDEVYIIHVESLGTPKKGDRLLEGSRLREVVGWSLSSDETTYSVFTRLV